METVVLASRFLLSSVFLVAGVSKLRPGEFSRAVENYGLVPSPLVLPIATWLPRFEILFGALLALGVFTAAVALAIGLLLVSFALAIAFNLLRGRSMECGCFGGSARKEMTWGTVLQDLALGGLALWVAAEPPTALTLLSHQGSATISDADALAALVLSTSAVFGARLLIEVGTLWDKLRRIPIGLGGVKS